MKNGSSTTKKVKKGFKSTSLLDDMPVIEKENLKSVQ